MCTHGFVDGLPSRQPFRYLRPDIRDPLLCCFSSALRVSMYLPIPLGEVSRSDRKGVPASFLEGGRFLLYKKTQGVPYCSSPTLLGSPFTVYLSAAFSPLGASSRQPFGYLRPDIRSPLLYCFSSSLRVSMYLPRPLALGPFLIFPNLTYTPSALIILII